MKELRANRESGSKARRHFIRLAIAIFVWAQLLDWSTGSGLLWATTRSRLVTAPSYALADSLRQLEIGERLEYLVIGDDQFLTRIGGTLGLKSSSRYVRSAQRDIRDCVAALQALDFVAADWVIIQSPPNVWSTFFTRRQGVANIHLWKYENRWSISPFPLEGVQLLFRTIAQWIRASHTNDEVSGRPESFEFLNFRRNPVFSDRIPGLLEDSSRVLWVEDLSGAPVDTNRKLVQDFRHATRTGMFDRKLGRFITSSQLTQILLDQGTQSSAD